MKNSVARPLYIWEKAPLPQCLGRAPAVSGSCLRQTISVQIVQNTQLDIGILSIYIFGKKSYPKHRMFKLK